MAMDDVQFTCKHSEKFSGACRSATTPAPAVPASRDRIARTADLYRESEAMIISSRQGTAE